ncbi:MAG: glycosyltransferase family 9 protein [Chloroflexota bacterium]
MDREALVARNRKLAAAFHERSFKERVRRAALYDLARLPIPRSRRVRPDRILLIRPDHLGDVLLTTPAIRMLRRALPYAEIHALVGPWSSGVLADYDDLDVVLTLPFPGFSRSPKPDWKSPYQLLLRSARHLRRIGYGSAVIFRPDHWWGAMLAHFAGIPHRVGYGLPEVGPFLTETHELQRGHVVEQNLRLVEHWTGPIAAEKVVLSYPVSEQDRLFVQERLDEWGLDRDARLIAIHPGSGAWVKRWQEERWAQVADLLAREYDATIVITGADHELAMARRIADRMLAPARLVVGDTQIGQLAALYERALLVLGPDSGPLHLAVAVETPTVALFGPADPAEFGPWGPPDRHIVLASPIGCRPCRVLDWGGDPPENHPCMADITVMQVVQAARRLLREHAPD